MLAFFFGADSYRRTRGRNEYVTAYRATHAEVLMGVYDFGECRTADETRARFGELEEFAASHSLFGEPRCAVVSRLIEAEVAGMKTFLEAQAAEKDLLLVLEEEGALPASIKPLAKRALCVEDYRPLRGETFAEWIRAEAKEAGVALTPSALVFLTRAYSSDTWRVHTELAKLASAPRAAEKKAYDVSDLERFGDFGQSENIFSFINGVARQADAREMTNALERLFAIREEPAKIFNILAASKYLSRTLLARLAEYDVMVKSGRIDYEEVLLGLALSGVR